MAHLDWIHDMDGDVMKGLNERELTAVETAMRPHLRDIRDFPFETAADEDILEYMAWAYYEMCAAMVPY